jgi:hypothetical protein
LNESRIGKKRDLSIGAKISATKINKWNKIKEENIKYTCQYCDIETIVKTNIIRWHGKKCKLNLNNNG